MIRATQKKSKYYEAVGRRKTAIARVRLFPTKNPVAEKNQVNDKNLSDYFPLEEQRINIKQPLKKTATEKQFQISAKIKGGGLDAQSDALSLGISRALLKFNPDFRQTLKTEGLLTRDARAKERRKFGLKKARKSPQWSKR